MSDDLVVFLLARIAEDEQVALKNTEGHGLGVGGYPDYRTYDGPDIDAADEFIGHFGSARMLAECEAKRRIIADYQAAEAAVVDAPGTIFAGAVRAAHEITLNRVVVVYRDHPDYQAEWVLSAETPTS